MPHIHEKIDFTAEVYIVNEGRVLLRKHDKYKIWLSIGGHVELDEDPTEAAVREAKEEVGLDVVLDDRLLEFNENKPDSKDLIPPRFFNRHRINETHEHVCFVYFARSESDQVINQEEELSDEIKWFTQANIDADPSITDRVRHYATAALKELAQLILAQIPTKLVERF